MTALKADAEFPDRMCTEPRAEHFDPFYKKIGVKLDGKVLLDVIEYCVSEGWVRRPIWRWDGVMMTERGRVKTVTHYGIVELYRR